MCPAFLQAGAQLQHHCLATPCSIAIYPCLASGMAAANILVRISLQTSKEPARIDKFYLMPSVPSLIDDTSQRMTEKGPLEYLHHN